MKKILLLVIGIGLLLNCSSNPQKNYIIEEVDGITVYKNLDKPADKNLTIPVKEVFRLQGIVEEAKDHPRNFYWPRFLDTDSSGNIYIVDRVSSSVKKFSKDGTFIKSFGSRGEGPGEMQNPFMIAILNEVVFVTDYAVQRMVKFNTSGDFIENFQLKSQFPLFMKTAGKDKFIGFLNQYRQEKDGIYQNFNLVLMDSQFKPQTVLGKYSGKYGPTYYTNFLERYKAYAAGKDEIFVAVNSEEQYRINVFDHNGKLLYAIEKEYQKIPFRQFELDELNRSLEQKTKKAGGQPFEPLKPQFKKAITGMFYDKEGRLLVASSVSRNDTNKFDFLVDVFKDGVFLNKVSLAIGKGYDFLKIQDEKVFFKGNRIFYLNENESLVVVFEY